MEYSPRIAPDKTKLFLRMPHAANASGIIIEPSHLVGGITKPSVITQQTFLSQIKLQFLKEAANTVTYFTKHTVNILYIQRQISFYARIMFLKNISHTENIIPI